MSADIEALRSALEALARLKIPTKPQGNAGAYSIRHSDIECARQALAGAGGGQAEARAFIAGQIKGLDDAMAECRRAAEETRYADSVSEEAKILSRGMANACRTMVSHLQGAIVKRLDHDEFIAIAASHARLAKR